MGTEHWGAGFGDSLCGIWRKLEIPARAPITVDLFANRILSSLGDWLGQLKGALEPQMEDTKVFVMLKAGLKSGGSDLW